MRHQVHNVPNDTVSFRNTQNADKNPYGYGMIISMVWILLLFLLFSNK